jgi:hypothetical protein
MFQQSVAAVMSAGVVGELFKGSVWRCQPGVIDTVGTTNPNEVGRVFTQILGVDQHCGVGGVIAEGTPFYGILCNPKEYVNLGTVAGGTLAPSLSLPQYAKGSFCRNTTGMFVPFQAAGNVGDFLDYDTTTGLIYPRQSVGNLGAATLAITSNVATVAGFVAGSAPIGVGTVFNTTNGPATVLSLGTGTGGNGTYNLSVIANQGATANTTYSSAPATGRGNIPNALVAFYNVPAAGLGVIALNNP